jgi:hypothetical protein
MQMASSEKVKKCKFSMEMCGYMATSPFGCVVQNA